MTVIDERMANRLGLRVDNTSARLQTVAGEPLVVSGVTSLRIVNGGSLVDVCVVVIPRMIVPGIDVLLGMNAHEVLGKVLQVNLVTKDARYVGAITQAHDQDVSIELADFIASRTRGRWMVQWKWKSQRAPDRLPQGPAVYRKKWVTSAHKDIAFRELQHWLQQGILVYVGEAQDHPQRGWLPINLVQQEHKSSTPVRVAVDLKWLNRHIEYCDEFSKYEVATHKLRAWRRIGSGVLVDLSKAFLRLQLAASAAQYLTIKIGNSLYELHALPFGLSIAPRVLYEVLTVILKDVPGVSFFRDDIFIADPATVPVVLRRLESNGFVTKTPEVVNVGMKNPVKLLGLTVFPVENQLHWKREEKKLGEHTVPSDLSQLTVREALGFLAALLPGMVPVAHFLRPWVAHLRSRCTKWAHSQQDWDAPISGEIKKNFEALRKKWQEVGNPMKGRWILPDPDQQIVLWTDASNEFLGYLLTSGEGEVLVDDCKLIAEPSQINLSELDAVIFGLQCCIEYKYKKIHLKTDSSTVVAWLKLLVGDKRIVVSGLHKALVERRLNLLRKMVGEFELKMIVSFVQGSHNKADALTRVGKASVPEFSATIGATIQDRSCAYTQTRDKVLTGELTDVQQIIEALHEELLHPSPATLQLALKRLGVSYRPKMILDNIKSCT
jgi:hypothetical protein